MRLALAILIVLALPGTAHAGGWASVELAAPPAGIEAGETWRAELVVKQHGVTPMDGLAPSVRIANDGGLVKRFRARPAGAPGTYVAEVVFPEAGTWRTRISDGFTNAVPHRLAPVTVNAAGERSTTATPPTGTAPPPPADAFPWPQAIAVVLVALAWLAGTVALRDRAPARDRRRAAPGAVARGPAAGS